MYWAIATITSIGYGDVHATSTNTLEQLVCTAIMYMGAIIFAQIVGSFCGLAASLSPDKAQFRFDLSDLNHHMEMEKIPIELRYRLREYVHQTVHLRQGETRLRLLKLLSPGLAGEFALKMNERWLRNIWFLKDVGQEEFTVKLALELRAQVFPHNENVPEGAMYIVSGKGRALYGGRVLRVGQPFRTDEVLEAPGLRASFPAIALSYLWTYAINGERLRTIVRESPRHVRERIRRHQMRLSLRRALVRAAEEDCEARGVKFLGRVNHLYARPEDDFMPAFGQPRARKKDAAGGKGRERGTELEAVLAGIAELSEAQARTDKRINHLMQSVQGSVSKLQSEVEALRSGQAAKGLWA